MPTFKVSVADRETGKESHITVEADDKRDAMAKVADGDTMVSGVVEVTAPPPPQAGHQPPPTDPVEAMLAELKQLRSWLPWTIAKGVLIGMLAFWVIAGLVTWLLLVLAGVVG